MYRTLVVVSFVTLCAGQGGPDSQDAQFLMNFVSPIYMCDDDGSKGFVDPSAVEVVRFNESTAYMTGAILFPNGFDHDTMVEIKVEKEVNGRYEMVFSMEICDVCEEVGDPDSKYKTYLQSFGFPEKCPFEAGAYTINDLVADTSDLPINSANAGLYLVSMDLYNNPEHNCKEPRTFIACLKFETAIEMA